MEKKYQPGQISEIITKNWIEITDREFELLTKLIYDKIGINLTDQKRALVMGRLQKLLRQKNFSNFHQYYEYVLNEKSGEALGELANYISTNHTFFYREKDHFEFFVKETLPWIEERMKNSNSNDIRIWSAGCSSGEEPYTLVMLMMEYFGPRYTHFNAGILATDISEKALGIAKEGIYSYERIRNLPEHFIKKYFKRAGANDWKIDDRVKNEVTFRKFNLMNEVFPFRKQFDTIFCRNVMIYFDLPTRYKLVDKFYEMTMPSGYLFIGHSESLSRDKNRYKYIMPATYRKL
jgi:chemotaxis protein methyltransferase CheR